MSRPSKYITKQSEAIFSYISSLKGEHVTAAEILKHFQSSKTPISTATIYRRLESLVESGKICKYTIDGSSSACYQIAACDECSQIHLKCDNCGTVFHIDCIEIANLPNHIYIEHSFKVNPLKTVFYGTCSKCAIL